MTRKLLEEALGVLESEYEGTDAHQELISNIRIYLTGVDRESCTHKFTREVVAGNPVWCVNCGFEKVLEFASKNLFLITPININHPTGK